MAPWSKSVTSVMECSALYFLVLLLDPSLRDLEFFVTDFKWIIFLLGETYWWSNRDSLGWQARMLGLQFYLLVRSILIIVFGCSYWACLVKYWAIGMGCSVRLIGVSVQELRLL